MPAWRGEGCTPRPGACPWLAAPLFTFFQESLASETRSLQTLAQGSPPAHPARSPLRSQTEAFHGFRSSTRSSSRRRLEGVTESDSRKKRHSDLLSQQRFPASALPPAAEAAPPGRGVADVPAGRPPSPGQRTSPDSGPRGRQDARSPAPRPLPDPSPRCSGGWRSPPPLPRASPRSWT